MTAPVDEHKIAPRRHRLVVAMDQAASAASNFVLTAAIARTAGVEELGRFTSVFAAYLLFLGLHRAALLEPALVVDARRLESGGILSATTVIGVVAGTMLAITAIAGLPNTFALLGLMLPALLLQDAYRYLCIRHARYVALVTLDLMWLAGVLVSAFMLSLVAARSASAWAGAWGVSAAVSVMAASRIFPYRPESVTETLRAWRREAKSLTAVLTIDSALFSLAWYPSLWLIAARAGETALGQVRAAQVLIAPLNFLAAGSALTALRSLARRAGLPAAEDARRIAVETLGACLALSAAIVLATPLLSKALLGRAAKVDLPLVATMALMQTCFAVAAVLMADLKARRHYRNILSARGCQVLFGPPAVVLLCELAWPEAPAAALALQALGLLISSACALAVSTTGPRRRVRETRL